MRSVAILKRRWPWRTILLQVNQVLAFFSSSNGDILQSWRRKTRSDRWQMMADHKIQVWFGTSQSSQISLMFKVWVRWIWCPSSADCCRWNCGIVFYSWLSLNMVWETWKLWFFWKRCQPFLNLSFILLWLWYYIYTIYHRCRQRALMQNDMCIKSFFLR